MPPSEEVRGPSPTSTGPPAGPGAALADAATRPRLSAEMLRAVLEHLGEGVVVADESGRFVLFNPAAERIVGGVRRVASIDEWPETFGIFLADGRTSCPADELPLARAIRGESSDEVELYVRNESRPAGVWLRATARPLLDGDGHPRGGVLVFRDVTERRRVVQEMQESRRQLELFFSQSLDGFFFMTLDEPVRWDDAADKAALLEWVFDHQRMTKVNDAMLAQYGATREQFLGLTPRDFYAHDLAHGKEVWRRFFDAGRLHVETDERRLDGAPIRIEGDYICLYDAAGRITGHFGIQRDVTERHRADAALRASREELRALAARLHSVREEEQRRIAREVHDELGQALTGLKLDLAWLAGRLPRGRAELANGAQTIAARIDDTLTAMRRITTELRPSLLDHLGLVAAVEWQAAEFQRRSGIPVRLEVSTEAEGLPDPVATCVFRVLQEALTNVARHAGAAEVRVALREYAGQLTLEVRDDGRGITAEETAGTRSLGLVGLRERAFACDGELAIRGDPGRGTVVELSVPHAAATQREAAR